MQLDKRKASTVNQMDPEMLDDQRRMTHRHGYPPPPPPPHTHTPSVHTPLSNLDSRSTATALHRSTDTPLGMYAMHRAKYKVAVLSSLLSPKEAPQTVQVPLSALSSAHARPGAVGGSFNSTSKMKSIPLPSIYDHNQVTTRGIRNITVHTERYTPSFRSGNRTRTISDSLLHLSESLWQKDHLTKREMDVHRSRALKKAREVIPHRIERAFYMNGHSAQYFNRQDFSPEELSMLESVSLSQNKDLYYGKGMRSTRRPNRGTSKVVQRFESQLREAKEGRMREYDDFSMDVGRVHRVSRAVTPTAVTIPEEVKEEVKEEDKTEEKGEQGLTSKETFITESQSAIKGACDTERTDCQ